MYKKFLIVASKQDKAGVNITTALSQFRKNPVLMGMNKDARSFDFYLVEKDILHEENLDLEKISKYDFIIFASKHASEKNQKTLSIHSPGNIHQAIHGGKPEKVSMSSALFNKHLFEILNEKTKEFELNEKYIVALEATHHGPLINKPCVFIEIGSTETEWNDRRAAFVIAQTINTAIENFKENSYREIAVGIGGPHYCPNFNKLQLKSNIALSHIISSNFFPLDSNKILEVVNKTIEEIDFAVIDWKGIRTKELREQIVELLEKNYIQWKKISDIKN